MIFINEPTTTQPDLPFGGTKGSGWSWIVWTRIHEFVNKKLIE
jgi:succinate-semialdehyde dehydrogenase/glutarate-semialdehyde dehydrogenase